MNCPKCGALMKLNKISSVEVDVCADHGLWLDKGELSKITASARQLPAKKAADAREKGRYEGIFLGWFSLFMPK